MEWSALWMHQIQSTRPKRYLKHPVRAPCPAQAQQSSLVRARAANRRMGTPPLQRQTAPAAVTGSRPLAATTCASGEHALEYNTRLAYFGMAIRSMQT